MRLAEPKIVQEVAFDTVQPRARHNSGYALRFPRIVRLLDDKPVQEIDTLETVRRPPSMHDQTALLQDADTGTQG